MKKNQWSKFVRQIREQYKKIRSVPCPAFGDEPVYFNKRGFNHLIRTSEGVRTIKEQKRRMDLVTMIPGIILNGRSIFKYRRLERVNPDGKKSVAYFWPFKVKAEDRTVIALVRQINDGVKHFFSVMDEWLRLE